MINPFSFQGPIDRKTYILWAWPLYFIQYPIVWAVLHLLGKPFAPDLRFLVFPLSALAVDPLRPVPIVIACVVLLVTSAILCALSFRRSVDIDQHTWMAAGVLALFFQLPIILYLSVTPAAERARPLAEQSRDRNLPGWIGGLQGFFAGIVLSLAAVALSTLVFGAYGNGVFLASPLVVGAVTAFMANRRSEMTLGETNGIVAITGFAGCMMMVGFALEGLMCIALVAPLTAGFAVLGGLLGREAALRLKNPGRKLAGSVALLPVIFAIEAAFPPVARFDTAQSIEVKASPERVWKAIVQMETIEEPLSLPHRLGLAYPLRGRVFGAGVGALRYGDFSTGTAIERVTEWEENRKLAFVVLKDIPGLRELSPYAHVHAPHVIGYFTTQETSFELIERDGGVTEILERTSHRLRLDPALYWLPIARYAVDCNNARVLRHIKQQAERNVVAAWP